MYFELKIIRKNQTYGVTIEICFFLSTKRKIEAFKFQNKRSSINVLIV